MTGLVLTILGIRLIIEYKTKWHSSVLLLLMFVGIIAFSVIPTEFWVQFLTTREFQQFINTVIGVGWIASTCDSLYSLAMVCEEG